MKPDSWVVKPDAAPSPSAGSAVIWDGDLNTSVRLVARQSPAWLASSVRAHQAAKAAAEHIRGQAWQGCL